jgi:hypothetical protein
MGSGTSTFPLVLPVLALSHVRIFGPTLIERYRHILALGLQQFHHCKLEQLCPRDRIAQAR